MMKKNVGLIFGMVLLVVGSISCSNSQENEQSRRGQGFNAEEAIKRRTEEISKQLDLSEEQKGQVKDLFKQTREKQMELRGEAGQERGAMREKMQEIQAEQNKGMKDILNEEQWVKWEEIRENFTQRGPRRRRGGQGT